MLDYCDILHFFQMIEIPSFKESRKFKSIQMFPQPVDKASQNFLYFPVFFYCFIVLDTDRIRKSLMYLLSPNYVRSNFTTINVFVIIGRFRGVRGVPPLAENIW